MAARAELLKGDSSYGTNPVLLFVVYALLPLLFLYSLVMKLNAETINWGKSFLGISGL